MNNIFFKKKYEFALVIIILIVNIYIIVFYDIKDLLDNIPKSLLVGSMIIFFIISYFWFVHKKKYLNIIEEYKDETKKIRIKKLLVLWVVVLSHIFIIFLLAYISKKALS